MTLACPARLCIALATTLAATGLLAQGVGPETVSQTAAPVERLIILYKDDAPALNASVVMAQRDVRASAAAAVSRSAGQAQAPGLRYLKSVSPRLHVARLDRALSAREAQSLMDRLRADPAVASVTVDQRVRPHAVTSDYFSDSRSDYYQWHLQAPATEAGGINVAPAWLSTSGAGVTVAVLDGGYRPHADLAGNLLTASDYDFIDDLWTANDGDASDTVAEDPGDWVGSVDATTSCLEEPSSWHGTHVAGLIGALATNAEGVGVAHGARVLPVRVLGRCGGYLSDIQEGMRWAAGLSTVSGVSLPTPAPRVLSLSLGVQAACDGATQSVVDEIRAKGVSVVASSGNEGMTAITKPANCMGVLAVTAHTRSGAKASYANVGPGVALSAPGGDTWDPVASTGNTGTTVPGSDTYTLMYGTSMAAPQAAGVLALMASARPDLSPASLEALMRGATRPFPGTSYCGRNPGFCGNGLLDAGLAVAAAAAAPSNAPDLEVLQRLDKGNLVLGEQAVFTVHVRNWGATTATGVQITAAVTGLDIQSVSANVAGTALSTSDGALSAKSGDLAKDAELVLTVTARVTATDGHVTSEARATSSATEVTLVNNEHRLVPAPLVPVEPVATADSGGGCTVAAGGQADMGLPLLLLAALLGGLWRRRAAGLNAPR